MLSHERSLFLTLVALACLAAGCLPATRGTMHGGSNGNNTTSARRTIEQSYSSAALDYSRRSVLQAAEEWLGTPYVYGGNSRSGIDCSGFVQAVFTRANCRLPRTSSEQAGVGETVDLSEARPGDLIFFNTTGGGVSHVGILVEGEQFVHASTSNGVTVSSLGESYYRSRFLFARRVLR